MLTKEQLLALKGQLEEEKATLSGQLDKEDGTEDGSLQESVGELSSYDNHPADLGTELYEREKDFALEEHADTELGKVDAALQAIENGSYGKCAECGEDIPFERLEAIPSTLYCVEHTPEQGLATDRPVEEELLEPAHGNTFRHRSTGGVVDHEDSFEEVARFGTSETPSDLNGDFESYDSLYKKGNNEEGFTEDYESFAATDITGEKQGVMPSKKEAKYAEMLDEENMESPLGDIPYREKDSYVDDVDKEDKKK